MRRYWCRTLHLTTTDPDLCAKRKAARTDIKHGVPGPLYPTCVRCTDGLVAEQGEILAPPQPPAKPKETTMPETELCKKCGKNPVMANHHTCQACHSQRIKDMWAAKRALKAVPPPAAVAPAATAEGDCATPPAAPAEPHPCFGEGQAPQGDGEGSAARTPRLVIDGVAALEISALLEAGLRNPRYAAQYAQMAGAALLRFAAAAVQQRKE